MASTSRLSAQSKLSIVFSLARRGAPRWPTTQVGWGLRHWLICQVLRGLILFRPTAHRAPDPDPPPPSPAGPPRGCRRRRRERRRGWHGASDPLRGRPRGGGPGRPWGKRGRERRGARAEPRGYKPRPSTPPPPP